MSVHTSAIYKEVLGNELYVYRNGHLIYKRWLNTQQPSIVFHWGEGLTEDCHGRK